jgi:hypothetical protein
MNVTDVTKKIDNANLFNLFENLILDEPSTDSQYGTISVKPRHFKDRDKNELKLGSFYSLFVAHMYKGEADKEFFYLLFYRKGEQRDYRKRSFHAIEYNKIFASGYSVEEIFKDFKQKLIGYTLK